MDARLPHLDVALDAEAMAGVLAAECLNQRYEVRDCRIGHVRYKPGRNCLIGYELLLRDRDGGVEFSQILCGRVYEPQVSEERWKKAAAQSLEAVAAGAPLTHIARMGMVVWAFPNERKLRRLGTLLDAAALAADTLPRILGAAWVRFAKSELVRYIPEHGCTVRVVAETDQGRRVLYAKAYTDDSGAMTFTRMKQIPTARPLAWENGVLWQEEIHGTGATLRDRLDACGAALATLHRTPVAGLTAGVSTTWQRTRELAAQSALELDAFDAVAAQLDRRRPEPLPAVTLHGDLHLKNFLLREDEAVLIDFDTLRSGDPLEDVGSFLASLYHQGAPEERIQEFVSAYARNVPWPVTERAVAWHTANALLGERASRAITRRKGDTPPVFAMLIETAGKLLEKTATARDVMRRFEGVVQRTPGQVLDVHYRTYRKQSSWHKSYVTVSYRNTDGSIEVTRNGFETAQWSFPHDPAMPWLAEAVSREGAEVLNYRPQNRCTWRYRSNGGALYAKTYCDDRGLAVHERLGHLWRLSDGGGPEFPMPEPKGYTEAIRTVWQAGFEGRPLPEVVDDERFVQAAGARLAFLHGSAIPCPARASLEAQWADLKKKMAKLATVLPAIEPRTSRLLQRLAQAQLPPADDAVVHGDFHLRQMVVRGSEVALFDFDEIGVGDPAEDFGHFAADLQVSGLRQPQTESINCAVIEGYQQAGGFAVCPERIRWHTTLQLLTRAYRALLQLKPDFEDRVERLVTLAEARQ